MHVRVCRKGAIFRQRRLNHSGVGGREIAFRRVYPARAYTTLVVLVNIREWTVQLHSSFLLAVIKSQIFFRPIGRKWNWAKFKYYISSLYDLIVWSFVLRIRNVARCHIKNWSWGIKIGTSGSASVGRQEAADWQQHRCHYFIITSTFKGIDIQKGGGGTLDSAA